MLSLFKKNKKKILNRFKKDPDTKLRLKYNPYYLSFEKQVGSHVWLDGKEMIMLSSNDYLGLTHHPKIIEAAKRALDKWGTSTTGSRLSNGSRRFHEELEERLAAFLGKEACHVHEAGYLSCMAAATTFVNKGDLVLVDRNVHSSLWSGLGLTRGEIERFGHNNPADLKSILAQESPDRDKIIIMEGVYSMEGHISRLDEFVEVTQGQNCLLVLDDAHGFGVLGHQGRGTVSHFKMEEHVDVICGSLSKAMASTGGFVAADKATIEYFRSHSKQTVVSAAISPAQAACALAAIDVMESEPEHLERLWDNTRYYKKVLDDLNLDYWQSETPAVPIVLGDKAKVYYFWKHLMEKGVFAVIALAPGVPPGKDLVRTSISARHTKEDLEQVAEAVAYAVKRM